MWKFTNHLSPFLTCTMHFHSIKPAGNADNPILQTKSEQRLCWNITQLCKQFFRRYAGEVVEGIMNRIGGLNRHHMEL